MGLSNLWSGFVGQSLSPEERIQDLNLFSTIPSGSKSRITYAAIAQANRSTEDGLALHPAFSRHGKPLLVDEGDTWRFENGLHATLECERSRQVDHEGERHRHRRVRTPRVTRFALVRGLTRSSVPAVAASLLHSTELPKERDFATVFYGGAPPSKQLAAEVKQRWPKAAMYVPTNHEWYFLR